MECDWKISSVNSDWSWKSFISLCAETTYLGIATSKFKEANILVSKAEGMLFLTFSIEHSRKGPAKHLGWLQMKKKKKKTEFGHEKSIKFQ